MYLWTHNNKKQQQQTIEKWCSLRLESWNPMIILDSYYEILTCPGPTRSIFSLSHPQTNHFVQYVTWAPLGFRWRKDRISAVKGIVALHQHSWREVTFQNSSSLIYRTSFQSTNFCFFGYYYQFIFRNDVTRLRLFAPYVFLSIKYSIIHTIKSNVWKLCLNHMVNLVAICAEDCSLVNVIWDLLKQ